MTTYISDQQARKLADLDERTRQAWTAYNESLRDLQGKDYEEAEDASWVRLQKRLKQLEDERALVEGG
jgi:outer membrane protein assembly factor BamD (BamD/ComL family)